MDYIDIDILEKWPEPDSAMSEDEQSRLSCAVSGLFRLLMIQRMIKLDD